MREVRNELSSISRAIEQEVARRSQQTTAELELANTEVAELERRTATAKPGEEQRASSSPIMAALERDAEATRQVLASLLKRQKEIDAQQTLQTADAQVIAYAAPPLSPSSPKKIFTIVAALLAGLVLEIVVALLRDAAAASR